MWSECSCASNTGAAKNNDAMRRPIQRFIIFFSVDRLNFCRHLSPFAAESERGYEAGLTKHFDAHHRPRVGSNEKDRNQSFHLADIAKRRMHEISAARILGNPHRRK